MTLATSKLRQLNFHNTGRYDDDVDVSCRRIMIIVWIERSASNIMVVQLPHANMILDPRIIDTHRKGHEYSFSVNGRILTITRIDKDEGWRYGFRLRVYLSTETIPDFASTIYAYYGLVDDRAPPDTTEVIFHPSVTTIQMKAFRGCVSLVRITIPDTVTIIGEEAFWECDSLTSIQLPRNLVAIGNGTFSGCTSLEAVYFPSTVTSIDDWAFDGCTSLRFFCVSEAIEHLGHGVFWGCDQLLTTVQYEYDEDGNILNNDEVNQWLMQRHANFHLHRACSSTSINPQEIEACIHTHGIERATEVDDQQMTALHILCANPHVTEGAIRSYLQLAPEAADQQDSYGMTPFQYLCRNGIIFLDDRNFSSLVAWWYGGMP